MKRILFQGDSITDSARFKESESSENYKGHGYASLVTAELGFDYPGEYEFFNRGISGNRIVDLYSRIKEDILNLKPDVLSILIGVNDVWHEFEFQKGTSTEKFEKIYDLIIEEVKENLPDTRIIILEPFVLKTPEREENWEAFRKDVEEKAAASKRIAEKHSLEFIPLMNKFDEAEKLVNASYWLFDGVHPTPMGHEIIKREWIKKFKRD